MRIPLAIGVGVADNGIRCLRTHRAGVRNPRPGQAARPRPVRPLSDPFHSGPMRWDASSRQISHKTTTAGIRPPAAVGPRKRRLIQVYPRKYQAPELSSMPGAARPPSSDPPGSIPADDPAAPPTDALDWFGALVRATAARDWD